MSQPSTTPQTDWIEATYKTICQEVETFIGYPCTANIDYSPLYRFLKHPINNVGDPFAPTTFRVNTKEIECKVLDWFAELTHADPQSYWGYVTNGGSEGNLYALYLARELFPGGMTYYSEETHYSVSKNLRMLKMPNIMLRTLPSGEIDYDDLRETIKIHRELPPIIFANIGTTMREAIDSITNIKAILKELAIPRSYIHCDAALLGMTLPFIDDAPEWDFAAGIDSISISGHKFIGSPVPCGIVLAKKANVDRIARSIEYVGTLDTTVTGSRNGITPLFLWHAIQTEGHDGFRRQVESCLATARYAVDQLNAIGIKAWRNPHALTVVFPKPPERLMEHWQIAVKEDNAHLICMQHVTREKIDQFVNDWQTALKEQPA